MKAEDSPIEGVGIFELRRYPDNRGSFQEIFRKEWFPEVFGPEIQMNCSVSRKGVIRGLHYHRIQYDFWVPLSGSMKAGLVDLREGSGTFGRSLTIPLDSSDPRGLLIPPGVAHGFAACSELILVYVVSNYYDSTDEYGIAWDGPGIDIEWGIEDPILSRRDAGNRHFNWP